MNRNLRSVSRVFAVALFPFALAVMAPLAIVIAVLLYVSGAVHALFHALGALRRQPAPPDVVPHQKPHFLGVSTSRAEHDQPKC